MSETGDFDPSMLGEMFGELSGEFDDAEDGGATKKSPLSFLSNMFGGNPQQGNTEKGSEKQTDEKDKTKKRGFDYVVFIVCCTCFLACV